MRAVLHERDAVPLRDVDEPVQVRRVPAHVHATMAFVRGVMARSTASGSMQYVSGVMSTITGTAPQNSTAPAVATKVKSGTITSSPRPIPSASRATSIAWVPLVIAMPCFAPW